MSSTNQSPALVQIQSTKRFFMGLEGFGGCFFHEIIDEKGAVGWAWDEMCVLGVEDEIDSKLGNLVANVLLNFNSWLLLDQTKY